MAYDKDQYERDHITRLNKIQTKLFKLWGETMTEIEAAETDDVIPEGMAIASNEFFQDAFSNMYGSISSHIKSIKDGCPDYFWDQDWKDRRRAPIQVSA